MEVISIAVEYSLSEVPEKINREVKDVLEEESRAVRAKE